MSKKTAILLVLASLLFLYLMVIQVMAIWSFTIDDMYVSLRYAKHWAQGSGLLWNVHEAPVEGYSNFSFVVLARVALQSGFDPVPVLKWAGVSGLYFTTLGLYCLTRFWFSRWLSLIPGIWLLFYKGQIIWTASGLETSVYQALICFALFFLLRATGYRAWPQARQSGSLSFRWLSFIASGVLLALASLTRPEAPFLAGLFLLIAWLDRLPEPSKKSVSSQGLLLTLLVFCLIYLPYFIWRWHYYGRLFPNPVYCKGLSDSYLLKLDSQYLRLVWPFLLLAFAAIWRAPRWCYGYFLLPSALYLLLLAAADPVSAFDNRLFLPCFALLLPLSLQGVKQMISPWASEGDASYSLLSVAIAFCVLLLFVPLLNAVQYEYFTRMPQAGERLRGQVTNWLDAHAGPNDVVVLADSGQIPYDSSLDYLDSYCLNNRLMTQQVDKLMYTRFCARIMKQKPVFIILTSCRENGSIVYTPGDVCLAAALKNNPDYQLQTALQVGDNQALYRYDIYSLRHRLN